MALQDVQPSRAVLAMSDNTSEFMKRFLKLFKLLDSDQEGERIAAANAIYRLCKSTSMSISDISITLEASEADLNKIFAKGVEQGKKQANGSASNFAGQYVDAFGEPIWNEIAKFCRESPGYAQLKPNEKDLVDDMPNKLMRWRAPTRPSGGFLLSIFYKLGGSFK
jgi:hypothetical protein